MNVSEDRKVEEMGFEEAMKELESLVNVLEKGELDLESSLAIFERAAGLRERCQRILDDSERRVQKIVEASDSIEIEDFK
jgi:exodeoxyribonuclease VII small subunit